jgi:serpin B
VPCATGLRPHPGRRALEVAVEVVLVAAFVVVAVACSPSTGTSRRSDVPKVEAPTRAAGPTADAVNAFGADLLGAVADDVDGNVAVTPYTTARGLAMSRVGAREATRAELDRALHAPSGADVDTGFNALDAELASREGTRESERRRGRVRIDSSASLWAQQDTRFDPSFLDVLGAQYDTGMRTVDFRSDPEEATKAVNRWVAGDTDGQVPDLVPRGTFSTTTRFVLTSACAVRAPWLVPFAPEDTADRPFTLPDGRSVVVPTMVTSSDGDLRTAQGQGWQAVELPYVGDELAMLVIVPDPGTLDAFVDGLTGEELDRIAELVTPTPVEVSLPAFAFTTRASLDGAFVALGLEGALTEGEADFSGITTDEPLAISDVPHQTFVSAGPEGSDADATTVVTTGAAAPPTAPSVRVDRPFVVAVRDVGTGAVLQLARVVDPRG